MTSIETVILATVPHIAVDVLGEGPAVVFLHGIGGNKTNWHSNMPALADRFCVIAWDARGYAESGDYDGPLTYELFADDLLQVLNILDIDQAHIVGLSMGSTIAAVFHDRYPERVKSITLCDGSMGYPRAAEEDAEFLRLRKDPLVNGLEPADIAESVAMSLIGNKTDVVNIDKIAASMRMLRKENYIKALDASVSCKDMRHQYTGIRVPALLIVGELDTLTPPGPMRETAAQIPNAEFQVIPGAGHLPNIEKPETFNQILSTFLDSVERDCLLKRRE